MRVQSTCIVRGESPSWTRHHDTDLPLAHGGTARSRRREGRGGKGGKIDTFRRGRIGSDGKEERGGGKGKRGRELRISRGTGEKEIRNQGRDGGR